MDRPTSPLKPSMDSHRSDVNQPRFLGLFLGALEPSMEPMDRPTGHVGPSERTPSPNLEFPTLGDAPVDCPLALTDRPVDH